MSKDNPITMSPRGAVLVFPSIFPLKSTNDEIKQQNNNGQRYIVTI